MSVTKTIEKNVRASQIVIDKTDPENTEVHFKFLDEKFEFMGQRKVPLIEMLEGEQVTLEEVEQVEAILKRIADLYNPYT